MTKKDLTAPKYSMQEMLLYLSFIFILGNGTGAMVLGGSSQDHATLKRIERNMEVITRDVSDLKEQMRDMKLKQEFKKK